MHMWQACCNQLDIILQAIDRQTSHHVALKIYHTGRLEELNRYQVLREVFLHSQLQHENIVQMYAAFQVRPQLCVICMGADACNTACAYAS